MTDMAPGEAKWALYGYHKSFGLLALVWFILRYVWRLVQVQPRSLQSGWMHCAAQAMHTLLYVLMVAMPLSGYVMSAAGGYDVFFFGWKVPNLVPHDATLGKIAHALREYISYALIGCILLHVVAALWHHYVRKDDVLKRMISRKDS